MTERLKILFLAANPANVVVRLRLANEIREISTRIRLSPSRPSLEIVSEWAVRTSDLQEALLRHRPHIVHFSGRGNEGIALQNDAGEVELVSKEALAQLFKILKDNIRLVVLNGCYAKDQAQGLSETIDYTIGIDATIQDKAALVFVAHFYQSLFFGRSLRDAFDLALNELHLEGIASAVVPELLVGRGSDASKAFLFHNQPGSFSIAYNSSKATVEPTITQPSRLLSVFLCHSSNDKGAVRELCGLLRADGVATWLDEEQLLPGQDWHFEITKAVRSSDAVLVCLSPGAINKTGYIQKELKFALDVADEQPEGAIFLIPVKLEECDIPQRIRRWHWVNLFEENGYSRLILALKARAATLGLHILDGRTE